MVNTSRSQTPPQRWQPLFDLSTNNTSFLAPVVIGESVHFCVDCSTYLSNSICERPVGHATHLLTNVYDCEPIDGGFDARLLYEDKGFCSPSAMPTVQDPPPPLDSSFFLAGGGGGFLLTTGPSDPDTTGMAGAKSSLGVCEAAVRAAAPLNLSAIPYFWLMSLADFQPEAS